MFNLFKKGESQQNNQIGDNEETLKSPEAPTPEVAETENMPEPVSPEQVFMQYIKDIREYLEVNGKIDPETIELMTGMSLEDTLEKLEKDEHLKLELSVTELKEAVTEALKTLDEPARENWLRKALNRPAVKGIFVAVMLFLKFAPDAQGAEQKEMDQIDQNNKTEASFEDNKEVDDANTYHFGEDDLDRVAKTEKGDAKDMSAEMLDLERFSQLELSNYYETDLDVISADNEQEIVSQFTTFLDNINSDNFQEIAETDFEVFGSSDERPTSNWEGSNEKLTEARLAAVIKIFKSVLANYDFGDRLTQEQKEQIQNKEFKTQMPEGGVTHLVDLINPDTGENYTEDEVAAFSEAERLELLKDCRRVDANFLAKKSVEIQEMTPKALVFDDLRLDNLDKTLTNWKDYYSVSLIVDNSPSMDKSYNKIAEIIKGQADLQKTEIKFGTFSDHLEKLETMDNLEDVERAIKSMDRKGSPKEMAIESALSALDEMNVTKVGEKMKLLLATDEPLQNLNYETLQQLKIKAEQKNCEVDIIYAHNRQGGVSQILTLEELLNSYQEIAWGELSLVAQKMIEKEESKLNRLGSKSKTIEGAIDVKLNRDNLKHSDREHVENYQNRLADLSEEINQSELLLSNLTAILSEGDLAKLESVIKENNSRYSKYKVNIDPSEKNIGVNLSLAQSK